MNIHQYQAEYALAAAHLEDVYKRVRAYQTNDVHDCQLLAEFECELTELNEIFLALINECPGGYND